MLGTEVDQPVRVERRASASTVEVELEALRPSQRLQPGPRRGDLLRAHPVLVRKMVGRRAVTLPGRRRVQLEAPPDHLHLVTMIEAIQRRLEPTLPHVTPRTHDVRPDFDTHA